MKYLHSGYILFCDKAEHDDHGMLNVHGLFDVFELDEIPTKVNCAWVIGFGTPYERRQYQGSVTIQDPSGTTVCEQEFSANDPQDIFKGHYVFRPEIAVNQEGAWVVRCWLRNWKDENMWDIERQFWVMKKTDSPPDP